MIYQTKDYLKRIYMEFTEVTLVLRYVKYQLEELEFEASGASSMEEHDVIVAAMVPVRVYHDLMWARMEFLAKQAVKPEPLTGTFIYESSILEFSPGLRLTEDDISEPLKPYFLL